MAYHGRSQRDVPPEVTGNQMATKVIVLGPAELKEAVDQWINKKYPRQAWGPGWTTNVEQKGEGFTASCSQPMYISRE